MTQGFAAVRVRCSYRMGPCAAPMKVCASCLQDTTYAVSACIWPLLRLHLAVHILEVRPV